MKPYSFGGRFYIREGANSQQMSRDEIREFFYKEGLIRFDETPCQRFDPNARRPKRGLDSPRGLASRTAFGAGESAPCGGWEDDPRRRVVLADDITRYSLQAGVTCALLRAKTHILDLKNFTGDLYSIMRIAWPTHRPS